MAMIIAIDWVLLDLNQRHTGYEPVVLPAELKTQWSRECVAAFPMQMELCFGLTA